MGVEDRQYAGTWKLRSRQVIKYTPDCLVYFNGDTALPGCGRCRGRIDMQRYITEVSVDAGVDSGATSASLSLSIPVHVTEQLGRDANFLLRVGLEVHIYMRGFFPMKGQFENIMPEETSGIDIRDVVTYPYYHVFHGVVIGSDMSFSGGFQTVSLNCGSMLHFWQFQNMSTSGSYFGARPANSGNKMTLMGHNFNRLSPYAIIYQLFNDVAGSSAGVGFALSSKTNQTAKSTVTGDSLFSLALDYWAERFSTKMMNLRMHGASGSLFNSAQAAFLGQLSSSEIEKESGAAWGNKDPKGRPNDLFKNSAILRLSTRQRDLATGKLLWRGSDTSFTLSQAQKDGDPVEFDVGAIQAYVQDIGQIGEVNLFESTYETKLEVANKVTEASGYEFYQDVDGDLVFKPPLYNLDTSSSRTYRIEDIDIIDISFSEKEPEVTYMTMKGSAFKNMKGLPTENEWGVKGQYIDYRLVAQFGWRPGSLETAYFNNSRAMFFASVNRMDVMNARVNSASVTIPLRPEIRAGYPVYIPYIDCYYYIESMSHSFSYGGQCSTSLQLTAKRAKFYAPGKPGVQGIEAITLGQPSFPEKPLEVFDGNGRPRLAGFPNVVMGLDPSAVNPLFFVGGADLEDVSNPAVIRNIIEVARQYNLLALAPGGNLKEGPFVLQISETVVSALEGLKPGGDLDAAILAKGGGEGQNSESMRVLTFTYGEAVSSSSEFSAFRSIDRIFQSVVAVNQDNERRILEIEDQIERLEGIKTSTSSEPELREKGNIAIANAEKALQEKGIGRRPDPPEKRRSSRGKDEAAERKKQIKRLKEQLKKLREQGEQYRDEIGDKDKLSGVYSSILNKNPTVLALQLLVRELRRVYRDELGDQSQLDLLADKKASFSNSQVPGSYRYFSASHPNPGDQGMSRVAAGAKGYSGAGALQRLEQEGEPAEGIIVKGFLRNPPLREGGRAPEAALGDLKVRYGIRIIRPQGDAVVPTSEIQTFSFAKHVGTKNSEYTKEEYYLFNVGFGGLGEKYFTYIQDEFRKAAQEASGNDTIQTIFGETWKALTPFTEVTVGPENDPTTVSIGFTEEGEADFPDVVRHGNRQYTTSIVTLQQFAEDVFKTTSLAGAQRRLTTTLSGILSRRASEILNQLWDKVEIQYGAGKGDHEREVDFQKAREEFERALSLITDNKQEINVQQIVSQQAGETRQVFYSPVFPVSDGRGYRVYGTYRYGRGLGISGESSLRTLAFSDPFQYASPTVVTDFVKEITSGKNTNIAVPDANSQEQNGRPIVEANLKAPITDAEKALQEAILANPESPQEILQWAGDDDQFKQNLRNWLMSSQDFGQKLPATNAAYLLSDLNVHQIKSKPCSCKAAEASIQLEAFSLDNFVQVLPPDADEITQFLATESQIAGDTHMQQQRYLRGGGIVVPNTSQGNFSATTDPNNQPGQVATVDSVERSFESANQASRDLRDALDRIGD